MTTPTLCAFDGKRPVPDTAYICPTCGTTLDRLLAAIPDQTTRPLATITEIAPDGTTHNRTATDGAVVVPGIASALEDVVRRQVRFTAGDGGHTAGEPPMPFHWSASDARQALLGTLIYWAAAISEQRGTPMPDPTLDECATYLRGHIGWLRAQAAGADAFDELTAAIRYAERVTDRPADRRYLGHCTATAVVIPFVPAACGADLYALEHHDTATCRVCHAEYPVTARRTWLLDLAADTLLPAADVARAVDGLGVPVSASTIRSWVRRRQLVAAGVHDDGRPTYRIGDVIALVEASARRRGDLACTG